jgi:hypothetical protein
MRGTVLALLLLVVACGNSSTLLARPSPAATGTPSPKALNGALPIWVSVGFADNTALASPQAAGGFMHFPGGLFRRDPAADMLRDTVLPRIVRTRTPDQPYLYAGEGSPVKSVQITYDRVVGRWLPVNQTQVSADGLRYAYLDYESGSVSPQRIHVVDVRSASDQVLYRDTNKPLLAIVGFAQQGVYLTDCQPNEVSGNCWGPLRRMDATTGKVTRVSDRRGAWVISGRFGWVETCGTAAYPPRCFETYENSGPNQLLGVDLVTGSEEVWDSGSSVHGGTRVRLIGIDGDGMALVAVNFVSPTWQGVKKPWGDAGESVVFRITAPEQRERLFSVLLNEPWAGFWSATADPVGIWLQATYVPPGFQTSVLDLYSKAAGGREISHDFWASPVGSFGSASLPAA